MTPDGGIVLVTGGAGAIGAAVCLWLANMGLKVAVADLNVESAMEVDGSMSGSGHVGFAMDVADLDAVRGGVDLVASEQGPVDVFVNVASDAASSPEPD